MSSNTNPGNFANRPTEEVKEIAAKGGRASHKNDGNSDSGSDSSTSDSGSSTSNTNPGNFANRPHEEVVDAARKGGKASGGGTSDE